MTFTLAVTLASLLATSAIEESPGVLAPAEMPTSALSVYGAVGYPELRVGLRQGMHAFEVTADAGLDYRSVKLYVTGGIRSQVLEQGERRLSLAARGGLYLDAAKEKLDMPTGKTAGATVEGEGRMVWGSPTPLAPFVFLRLPLDIPFSDAGATRATLMAGAGVELGLGADYYLSLLGEVGPQLIWAGGRSEARLLGEAFLALGCRLF